MQSVLQDMVASGDTFEVGIIYAQGKHTYIAHRYPSTSAYGSIILFDAWSQLVLGTLNEGTFTTKDVSFK